MYEWKERREGGKRARGMGEAGTVLYINTYIFTSKQKQKEPRKKVYWKAAAIVAMRHVLVYEREKGRIRVREGGRLDWWGGCKTKANLVWP